MRTLDKIGSIFLAASGLVLLANADEIAIRPKPGLYREILVSYVEFDPSGKPSDLTKQRQASNPASFCMTAIQAQQFFNPSGMEGCNLKVTRLKNGDVESNGICPSGWTIKAVNRVTPKQIGNDVWFSLPDGISAHKISRSERIGDCPKSPNKVGR